MQLKPFQRYLKAHNISIRYAAHRIGCNAAYLSRVLSGKSNGLSEETLADITSKADEMMMEDAVLVQAAYGRCLEALSAVPLLAAKRILRELMTDVEAGR